jgi:hypothetical protein
MQAPVAIEQPAPVSHRPIHWAIVGLAAGQTADAVTTAKALKRGGTVEVNPLYGKHPSTARVVATKAAIIGPVAFCLHWAFPRHPRATTVAAWLLGGLGASVAVSNSRQGR